MTDIPSNPFKEYLDKKEERVSHFSVRSHVSETTVAKAYKGLPIRIDSARKIIRHSNKKLTLKDFGY